MTDYEAAVAKKQASGPASGLAELPVPLYEHVKRRMAEAILLGEWPPGMVLPGEVALAAEYGVAVGTMRRALADLTADGMLMRRRKTGTIVTGRTPQHSLRFFFQYYRMHGPDGRLLTSEAEVRRLVIEPATSAEALLFGEAEGEPMLRIERVRRVDGRAVMRSRMALVARRLPNFPMEPAEVPQRLYIHLLDSYGIRISAVREQVSAGLAIDEDRAVLDLPDPAALLVIDEEAFDQAGALTIVGHHRTLADNHRYVNEVR
ncbi:GntR family transcriptional regulator [Azospirillum canadense]|uniref:GntR family transcriptional regulator n=1 Tax=Azospirillum canadense TaxID=403962 RepID=UPI002225D4A0|nr:GntR family transcriptional regulator [Azospirillum canadense]MCW2240085.1 GntR family transcriptional regulator [Azospirillum canadense]